MAGNGNLPDLSLKVRMLLLGIPVLVILGVVGVVWISSRPVTTEMCTLRSTIDNIGATTPAAARERLLDDRYHGVDAAHPDHTSGSDDSKTAIYDLEGPAHGPADPDGSYYLKVVTEKGDDGVWRVTSDNECSSWS